MELVEGLAIAVFILTFLAFAFHKNPWFELKRSYVALIGALLMILIGAVSLQGAINYIRFDIIFLLIGMMFLVAGLEYTGFFTLISDILLKHSKTKVRLLAIIMAVSAVLTMVTLNDAVALMFTPIVIRCCMKIDTNPIPYLIGMLISVNLGGVATAIGNPQNAFIASKAGIDFVTFSVYSLPISVLCMIAAFFIIWLFFRKQLSKPYDYDKNVENMDRAKDKRMWVMIAITVITFVFFIASGPLGIKIWQIAVAAGIASLIVVMTSSVKEVKWMVKRVDWHIVLFFIGLFVVIGGAKNAGLISSIASLIPGFGPGETPGIISITVLSSILCNLVSNVPSVVVISEMLPLGNISSWITLAASSTIAGNATLLGSASNIIVAERAEKMKVGGISYFKFLSVGMLVTLVSLAIMLVLISLFFIN